LGNLIIKRNKPENMLVQIATLPLLRVPNKTVPFQSKYANRYF